MIITCKECGKKADANKFHSAISTHMRTQSLCFDCAFWTMHLKADDGQTRVVIDGKHYVIGVESQDPPEFRGFGGRAFHIKFHDGREVVTSNLWTQGVIPDHFKGRFPDNAIFVKKLP